MHSWHVCVLDLKIFGLDRKLSNNDVVSDDVDASIIGDEINDQFVSELRVAVFGEKLTLYNANGHCRHQHGSVLDRFD